MIRITIIEPRRADDAAKTEPRDVRNAIVVNAPTVVPAGK